MTVASQRSGLRSRAFRLLLIATVAGFTGYALLLPLVPLWASRGGASELGAGATTAVFMLTTVLTQLAMPWLLSHGGYRWTMPVGGVLLGGPAPLLILTGDLSALIAISAVRGVGFGMVSVVGAALAARLVPEREIGRAAGYYGFAVGIPNVVFLAAGVGIASSLGFPVAFWLAALGPLVGAVAAIGVWRSGRNAIRTAPTGGTTHATAAPTGARLWVLMAAPLLIMLALASASSAIVTFLALPLSDASWVAGTALLAYGGTIVIGRALAGIRSDRSGRSTLLAPSVATAAVGMVLLAVALWPAGPGWQGPGTAATVTLVAGAALFGIGFGGVQNDTIVVMFRRGGSTGHGTASAAWNIGYDAGTGVGAVVLGVVMQSWGYGPAFSLATVLVLVAVPPVVALGGFRRSARRGNRAGHRG